MYLWQVCQEWLGATRASHLPITIFPWDPRPKTACQMEPPSSSACAGLVIHLAPTRGILWFALWASEQICYSKRRLPGPAPAWTPGSDRCWAPCQVVQCFCSVVPSHSFLITFTKESKLLGRSGHEGKGMKTRLMVGSARGSGYLVPLDGTSESLVKGPLSSPQFPPSPQAMVTAEAEENFEPSSHRKGKHSWALQRRFHLTLIHCLYHVLGYQQDKKKCKILEWACNITLILLRVSASQAEVIHSLFWSCSSPL